MAANELIAPINHKEVELANSIIKKANLDRDTAKEVYTFVKKEIDTMLGDYLRAKDLYDSMFNTIMSEENIQYRNVMMCKLGKPPRRPNVVMYVSEMNKAVENSIKSTGSITDLLNIISRSNTKKVNVEEINIDNRSMLLDEIIRSKNEHK